MFVSWLPLYHDLGLIGANFASLVLGFPTVLMSPLAFLSRPVSWMRAIHRHRGTMSGGPNFSFELCLRRVDDAYCDPLELREDSRLGVTGLLQAARLGHVAIANPIGSGVLENPGLMAFLRDDMLNFIGWFEREGLLTPNNAGNNCGSGGFAPSNELHPAETGRAPKTQ